MTKIIWAMVIVQSQGEKNRFTTNDMPVPARCRLLRVPERLQQQQIKVLPLKVEMVVHTGSTSYTSFIAIITSQRHSIHRL